MLIMCLTNDIGDVDLAFGQQAVTRTYKRAGFKKQQKEYHLLAEKAADLIEKESDREYFLSELSSI